jgi:hypothetical protein
VQVNIQTIGLCTVSIAKIIPIADGLISERRWRLLGLVNSDNTRDINEDKNKVFSLREQSLILVFHS